ncbi:MAG: hypothetical protein HY718_04925 [Planctomycetes bacterium]|nr:hypothetical protein [Planctomycetota bacterium]
MNAIYISSIHLALGDAVALEALDDPEVSAELARLGEEGLRRVRVAPLKTWQLAAEAATGSLGVLDEPPPDGVIYTSDDAGTPGQSEALSRLLTALDLQQAAAVAIGGHGCGNLGPALRVARALMIAEGWSRVLFVTADRAGPRRRLRRESLSVLGDGAAACVLENRLRRPSFELCGVATATLPLVPSDGPAFERARLTLRGVRAAVDRLCEDMSVSRADFDRVVVNNYGATARQLVTMAAGVSADRVLPGAAEDTGHCFSADPFINICRAQTDGVMPDGSRVLVIANGAASWSALGLRAVLRVPAA